MRLVPGLFLSALLSIAGSAQTLAPKPSTLQHVTVETTASAAAVAKGGVVTLWADITPKPNIHVYAADWQGFTPVTLVLTPRSGVTIGKVKYPIPELAHTVGVSDPVGVYTKPFRLAQPITVAASAKSGDEFTIAGVVNYQACDDRVCYPTASLPVRWTVTVT
jgi:DsbC/DsbD-like thiol-disulfide interchange protein